METRDPRESREMTDRAVGRDVREVRDREVIDVRTPEERAALERDRAGDRDRSVADLVRELRDESSTLLRQEVALAKTEMSEKLNKAVRNTTAVAVGSAVLYGGFLMLLIAAGAALTLLIAEWGWEINSLWLGPLIVGVIAALIGYAMMQKGISTLKEESPVPEKTVQSLKEDKQWMQEKMK